MFALQHRALIISIAYSILGSYSDAEDVAQDVTEKWLQLDITSIVNQKHYLIRLTINHSLNHQQHQQRLAYKGQWLPEPVNNQLLETKQTFELQDLLSYELTTQLSRLSPYERAVFILKEAFELNHREIAQIIDKTPDNTRQIFSRAKSKISQYPPKTTQANFDKDKALQFALHIQQGNLEQLIELFKDDIQVFSDGGGKVTAALVPIIGAEKVGKFYIKIAQNAPDDTQVVYDTILGQPALLLYQSTQLTGVVILSLHKGKIQHIYSILNPDKLTQILKKSRSVSHFISLICLISKQIKLMKLKTKALHYISGITLSFFIGIHLLNHLTALVGAGVHIKTMQLLRQVYRQPIIEVFLLIVVVIQIVSGIQLLWRTRQKKKAFYDRLQWYSGLYLAFFLIVHTLATVWQGRQVLHLDTNFYYAAIVVNRIPTALFFMPYYLFAVMSVFGHIAAIHYKKTSLKDISKAQKQARIILITGFIIGSLILLSLQESYQEVQIPPIYNKAIQF